MALRRMQSFVEAAGEALGLTEDPLQTEVGMKIEEATKEDLKVENLDLNKEICDIINTTEGGPEQAVRAIKRILQNSLEKSPKTTLFTLTVLETCVKNCGKDFVFLVCQREFAFDLIRQVISPNMEPSKDIQDKVLSLIQSWALEFSSDRDLNGIAEVYMYLKNKGLEFPAPSDEDLKETDSEDIEAWMEELEGETDLMRDSEIEAWMEEHEGETDLIGYSAEDPSGEYEGETDLIQYSEEDPSGEDEISDEFNKFLEKRVESAFIEEKKENSEENTNGEDATSDEFNKFLEKRVEAVKENLHTHYNS
eukprot:GFUD01018685.1.p1 GENE.GFUD01018685.1~~GFUD01018685.1.p1  ORF type:complete len:308 (+),score=105.22 GFUD01018685.1:177-1100(+)